ncbi:MAG: mechanosensitive ion channel domain-containing protein [Pseudomonadota bacterium]
MLDDPLSTEIWAGQTLGELFTLEMLASVLGSVVAAILILFVGWVVSRWIGKRIIQIGLEYDSLDDTLFNFLGSVVRYTILAFTLLIVLNTFGVRTTSIVAAIGAAGLAIGLALQGTLSNVAAGVMLIVFRPLKIGDFVEVNGEMGTVRDVTLNHTELASLENVQVIVPNALVWGNTIHNFTGYPLRRAELTFHVAYSADLDRAEQIIRDAVLSDSRSKPDPEPFVQVHDLASSSVEFLVRVWCDAPEFIAYKADITRKVKDALDAGGIEIPFPHRVIIQK